MPICRKCDKTFPNEIRIDGKRHVLNKRKFCLECSPYGTHNTKDITNIPKVPEGMKFCTRCKTIKHLNEFRFRNGEKDKYRAWCSKCICENDIILHKERKEMCVEYKGGKCAMCGYNKCVGSLVFHHIDPTQKDFNISRWTSSLSSFERVRPELDKCVLLCANCHGEVHAGIVKLPDDTLPLSSALSNEKAGEKGAQVAVVSCAHPVEKCERIG